MKKILCVLPQVTGGGAERFLINFLQQIDRSQYKLELALVRKGGGFDCEVPDDVQVHVLTERDTSTKLLAPFGPVRYVLALVKLIAETKPDAILSFGSLLNGAVALAARRFKFLNPVVLIEAIHESSEISRHYALERWTRNLFLRLTYPLASEIVAVSEDVECDLRDNFGIIKGVQVIHYGIDLENIRTLAKKPVSHTWLCSSRKHKTIVSCGRLVSQKGFNILIDAISELPDDIKLILVGDGKDKVKLARQVQQLKLQERVELVGYDRNPYRYIAKADLFIMPSLWEGFGIVLIEAMALGIPTIASDCPTGPRIILKDGECGMLVPPGDAKTLASNINKLLSDQQLRNQLSIAAKHRAESFSVQTAINAYINLLSELGEWT